VKIEPAAESISRSFQRAAGAVFARSLLLLPATVRGRLIRWLLPFVPARFRLSLVGRAIGTFAPGESVPILSGPLRGAQWVAESSLHSCIAGDYEQEVQDVFVRHIQPGGTVFDIGANVGFMTLLAARLVGEQGRVVAFEPFSDAVRYLRRHLELNGVENVQIIEAAVSQQPGRASFRRGQEIMTGRLALQGEDEVDVVSLDDLCAGELVPVPNFLKIDVEGEEANVLLGSEGILTRNGPVIMLATHGSDVHKMCCEFLDRLGYEIEPLLRMWDAGNFDYLGELVAIPSKIR
jgi:FkbM family methyltransferase